MRGEISARQEAKRARELLVESLSGPGGFALPEWVVGGACLVVPLVLIIFLAPRKTLHSALVEALMVVVTGASFVLGLMLRERALAALRTLSLQRVGHGFDAGRYLALLAVRRRDARLLLELQFARAWPAEQQGPAAAAVSEWVPGVSVLWKGDRALKLQSRQFSGRQKGSDKLFSNQELHECFRQVAGKVVPKLHAVVPLASLGVEIVGEIVSFEDEDDD